MDHKADRLTDVQREALWKWRWLGWRNSTPAFKASIGLLVVAAAAVAVVALR
jgi:hypothetical protein